MGQDISGTALGSTSTVPTRKLTARLMIDWDDIGFSDALTGWYDETQYLEEARGNMRALNWQRSVAGIGGGVANLATLILCNPDLGGGSGLRFSSSNAAGPLYAKLGEGKINMVRAVLELGFYDGVTPDRLRQITGYIVSAHEDFRGRRITLEVRDRAADDALCRAATAVQQQVTAADYLNTLCGLTGRDPVQSGDQVFDQGVITVPYQWLDDETIWDEIAIVCEAQAGRVWFDKDGDLHFDDSTHWVKGQANSWDDPCQSQATFTVASFADLQPAYDLDSVWNHIVLEYSPRYLGWEQAVYNASEIVTIAPGESNKLHRAKFHNPVVGPITPVANVDYLACSGGGIDMTSAVTVAMTAYGEYAKLQLSNANTDYTAYVTKLQIRATPLLSDSPIKYEDEDSSSIAKYGRRTWPVRRNPYVQSESHAMMIVDFLLSRFKDPVQIVQLRGVPARPWLEVGDRITVQETLSGIDAAYLIVELTWSYKSRAYTQDITAIRISDLFPYVPGPSSKPYFIIGTTQYGTHGRLFW